MQILQPDCPELCGKGRTHLKFFLIEKAMIFQSCYKRFLNANRCYKRRMPDRNGSSLAPRKLASLEDFGAARKAVGAHED